MSCEALAKKERGPEESWCPAVSGVALAKTDLGVSSVAKAMEDMGKNPFE